MTDERDESMPEGYEAAQQQAADAAPDETSIGQGSPDADKMADIADSDVTPTGGVVDTGMPG